MKEPKFNVIEKISKGYSSEVFLAKDSRGKLFALKKEKAKSTRHEMVKKEAGNLRLANSVGVGPKLVDFSEKEKWILMEFIEGKTFSEWLFKGKPARKELAAFLRELFAQAEKLDAIGLDHGQLAGKGKNILVRKGKPVIIDFEKASPKRKPHNVTQLASFIVLNRNGAVAGKVRKIFGKN
ncbi:MAG: RIO1 family regulatory kinase/ATPase [Candidatus Diapherotrites archaeon]